MSATRHPDSAIGLLDLEDTPASRTGDGRLPEPRALYNQWEKQQWAIARLEVSRDRPQWERLRPVARQELLAALNELEVGEVFVSRTLSTLVGYAPSDADRLFLSTQVADEARHAQFFRDYLHEAVGLDETVSEADREQEDSVFFQIYAPTVRSSLDEVASTAGDPVPWHTAVVEYHLVTEGILAAAALHQTRQIARRFNLLALEDGLGNVIRDESRHFTYGLAATRHAVQGPLRERISAVYLAGVEAAARISVNPYRRAVTPVLPPALAQQRASLAAQWDLTRRRALRQLRFIGLSALHGDTEKAWDRGLGTALSEYANIWGAPHPVTARRYDAPSTYSDPNPRR
jgi:ribonucleoside-diphosphate reductase beta chain